MAAHGWGKSPSVESWLFDEPGGFDFYQAVALLERIRDELAAAADPQAAANDALPRGPSVAEGSEPAREAVQFRGSVSLAFPESEIESLARVKGRPPEMTVGFMSLAGALGPLPQPFSELVFQRSVRADTGVRDFLDIFNHRLTSLIYRIRKAHRIGLGAAAPDHDEAAKFLFAFMGLLPPTLREKLGFPARALLFHAGMFSHEARSMAGLEAVLRTQFGVPVQGVSLTGRYTELEPDDVTAIGPSGKNRALGRGALLGGRVWDQQAAFELVIGPLRLEELHRFLPGPLAGSTEGQGDALAPLCRLVRFYAGPTMDFTLRVLLRAEDIPPAKIGKNHRTILGYTSWLGTDRPGRFSSWVCLGSAVVNRALKQEPRPASPAR